MNTFTRAVFAGIIGTIVMTLFMVLGAKMGMPKISPPDMLSSMLGISLTLGWSMHFMIGIIFALSYSYLFGPRVKINNIYFKGITFGIAAFVFAQIMLAIMGTIFPMPIQEGNMVMVIMGSVVGHIVFGVTVALIAGPILATKLNS
ncbi:hypothetical protein EV196_11253 [Mariniflexile fucanivorans]|uniref:DUF1440 domain-containing protein n=1 Tax=Mariniflexile fucanivorans TaxID=264023 RepID=A0A4R1RAD1_9FLAO|nr:DUF6789 family protein [Mariniflexile fucanivorans]TCL62656.1 hypothetical protein EV196_11253 [Mariniflexile fucanivorans]